MDNTIRDPPAEDLTPLPAAQNMQTAGDGEETTIQTGQLVCLYPGCLYLTASGDDLKNHYAEQYGDGISVAAPGQVHPNTLIGTDDELDVKRIVNVLGRVHNNLYIDAGIGLIRKFLQRYCNEDPSTPNWTWTGGHARLGDVTLLKNGVRLSIYYWNQEGVLAHRRCRVAKHPCNFPGCERGGDNGFPRKDKLKSHFENVHRGRGSLWEEAVCSAITQRIYGLQPKSSINAHAFNENFATFSSLNNYELCQPHLQQHHKPPPTSPPNSPSPQRKVRTDFETPSQATTMSLFTLHLPLPPRINMFLEAILSAILTCVICALWLYLGLPLTVFHILARMKFLVTKFATTTTTNEATTSIPEAAATTIRTMKTTGATVLRWAV
ncbi:MAG: hypothetical protein Q9182_003279 [Xanthomendoza sp. 2 TL-2023]